MIPIMYNIVASGGAMPSVRGTGTGGNGASNDTTYNAPMPATVNAGDILILGIMIDDNETFTIDGAEDAEWTKQHGTNIETNAHAQIWTKVADGAEGGTTVNFDNAAGRPWCSACVAVQDANATFDASTYFNNTSSITSTPAADVTTTVANCFVIHMWLARSNPAGISTHPATVVDVSEDANFISVAISSEQMASTGTTSIANLVYSATEQAVVASISLKPA